MADPDAFQGSLNIFTEVVRLEQLIEHEAAWTALIRRALEPNAFLDPAFALPLYRSQRIGDRPQFLLVWHGLGPQNEPAGRERLIGLLPIATSHVLVVRIARSMHTPLGTPLLDQALGLQALSAMADGLRQSFKRRAGLKLTDLPKEGATVALLRRYADMRGTPLIPFNTSERACLYRTADFAGLPESFISAKRRKFYRQQRRRLDEGGQVTYRSIRAEPDIHAAAEAFLSLEAKGWKGRHKSAFLNAPTEAQFFRSAIDSMAQQGRCRIDSLEQDGAPIAMGVILESGDRAFFWKTCFDERVAALSPGAQLTLELTRTQLATASISLTDSCAIPDHPMINRIWRQRLVMTNLFLPLRPQAGGLLRTLAAFETAYSTLRQSAKTLLKQAASRLNAKAEG